MDLTCGAEMEVDQVENSSSWGEGSIEADVTMARRSQCSDAGDNPLDPHYLPPHYREEYRLAIDALVEEDIDGYYKFLQFVDVVDFLSASEIDYIQQSIQLPKQSSHPEQRYLDAGGDGSSDTYWPLHSDLDAPGLDLGWPQIHHFIGPTEVTTLVNPAAPDMPSIKEQARRLIKNAQMVVAVVMDMFTDVDIFKDILNAAMRNVAVYLLLDEANVDHFINMVNNCRVNLQSLQYLRVRTVSGITYHCRTGKSFKGQMLDRFILTDCRAVLSGNYSFMWSYEKLHRCMAHLFLGQLVSTFDEEFRILFAQSEPLIIENMEDMTILQNPPLQRERPLLRDTRKYRTMDMGHQEEWNRQPYEENMDWRMTPLKRQDTFHGPMDIYNRYPSPQSRLDPQTRLEPQFDQGPPRLMDNLGPKRHNFGEGGGPGRYNFPYGQQGLPEAEQPGRPYFRGQQHLHQRDEPDYGGYGQMDKFWNQDFNQEEPYPEPGYPQDIEPHDSYDPVLNYLSSTRNVDIDQSSDKLIPGPDLPYSTMHPRRHIGQAYTCQTSPTPSNTTEKKFMTEHSSDRKDPTVKKGLRNWRISSYLSAYDGSGEPEGLPMGQGQTIDPFDDMPMQQPTPPPPAVVELAVPKIPNVREFKVPALPRASQMPAFTKTAPRDLPKRFPDEMPQVNPPVLVIPEPKVVTPTPSESSSTTDGEKQEEPEQREPITSGLRRDDSFRRNYNAAAVQRSSRLRSSLIFSSLEQNTNQDNTEQEDKAKAENETTKLPFVSQVLAQRRSGTREPFEWRSYIKTADNTKTEEDGRKQVEKDSESKLESLKESQDAVNSEGAKSKEMAKIKEAAELATKADKALLKPPQTEGPKIEQPPPPTVEQPTKSFLSEPFLDMSDPDQRFLFFKEMAAKRKAAKAAEEAKSKQESATKDKKEGISQRDVAGSTGATSNEDSKKVDVLDLSGKTDKVVIGDKKMPTRTQSCEKIETNIVTKDNDPNKVEQTQKSKEESKKVDAKTLDLSGKMDKVAIGDKTVPTVTQSCEKVETKIVTKGNEPIKVEQTQKSKEESNKTETKVKTDSEKIEAKQSQVPLPTSAEKQILKSNVKQDKPTGANAAGTPATVEKVTKETQQATTTSATSNDPQLKTSRSVPDFAKSSMSDLLSSLPSARIYERSLSQEANKDTTPKPRLWSPSLHKRELLKPYGDKTKSISTVVQIEEAAEEASPTAADAASGTSQNQEIAKVKSQTETKQNQDSKGETAACAKGRFLPTISENKQPQQDGKETGPLQSISTVESSKTSPALPTETSSSIPHKIIPQNEKCLANSAAGATQVKDPSHFQSATSEKSKTKEKTELPADKEISKKDLVKTSASDESIKPTPSVAAKQDKDTTLASISDPKQPLLSQNKEALVKSSGIVVIDGTEQEKCSDGQVNASAKPLQAEKLTEKSTVVEQVITKEACPKEMADSTPKADKLASTTEKYSGETTPSGKDGTKETGQSGSVVTQEEVELTADSLVIRSNSKDPEKSSSTSSSAKPEQETTLTSPIDETKLKPPIVNTEDFTPLESHSDTSSPASFATALEFMDSDVLSPARTDPHHLYKSGNTESSVSDMSDFETPSSEISMSPMLFAVNMDDTTEDNVSIAETVIEAASRRKSETIEQGKMEDGVTTQMQEVSESDLATQDTAKTSETRKIEDKMACPATPATSGEMKETKMDKTAEVSAKDVSKPTEPGKESTDVQNVEPKVSAEIKPVSPETSPTNQSAPCSETAAKASEISSKDSAVSKELTSEGPKREIKTRTVSSRFLSTPSTASVKPQASAVTPKVTEEATVAKKTDEIKEESKSTDKTCLESTVEMGKEAKEEKAQNLEASDSETKLVATNTNTDISNVATLEPKIIDQTPAASENIACEKDNSDSKTEVSSSPAKQSETCQATIPDTASQISTKDADESITKGDKETETKTVSSQAASEDTKESKIIMEKSTDDQTEQKSKDTSVNAKNLEPNQKENTTPEPANAIETTPTNAQPKQQPKPQSRYQSSTANVISSSNLRDDTKILLEQISANSQSRNESTAAKEAPVTDDEKEDEADKNAKRKKENELRASLGQQKPSQEREKVLERIQTMRKDRKVYSRFEL